ncbi:hypothetical protein QAD02_008363 [Eretmocerus hayati]|uniref:Uncharacterized protein n=1 Tax=Eretmocerus hayati TaxID=131215 RepID=A0ACC2N7N2_9HYME|nr:hypothetical protein QAD02_008363 [Eretmocerus hayati]
MTPLPNVSIGGWIMTCLFIGAVSWFQFRAPSTTTRNRRGGRRKSRGAKRAAQLRRQVPGGTVNDPEINSRARRQAILNDPTADRTELRIFLKRKVPSWWKQFQRATAFMSDNLTRDWVRGRFDADAVILHVRLFHAMPEREYIYAALKGRKETEERREKNIRQNRVVARNADESNHHLTWKDVNLSPNLRYDLERAHDYGQMHLNLFFTTVPGEFELEREMSCWSMGNCACCGNSAPIFRDCAICFDRAPRIDAKEARWMALNCSIELYNYESIYKSKHVRDLHEPWTCRPCRGKPPLGIYYPTTNRWAW